VRLFGEKLNLYAEFGVAEYWMVDPDEQQFDFLVHNTQRLWTAVSVVSPGLKPIDSRTQR